MRVCCCTLGGPDGCCMDRKYGPTTLITEPPTISAEEIQRALDALKTNPELLKKLALVGIDKKS